MRPSVFSFELYDVFHLGADCAIYILLTMERPMGTHIYIEENEVRLSKRQLSTNVKQMNQGFGMKIYATIS